MKKEIKSITLGGIFAACYAILTAIFIYALPVLASFAMIVLPIFSAFFATKYKFKETFIFNLATIIVCFLVGIGDPFFCLLYVLPSLIIGDVFGLLNRLNIKFYATIFFQSLVFSFLNYLTIILAEKIYEISIIELIIFDEFILENFSLCILFLISFAEAVMCTLFVSGELKKLNINKEIEDKFPKYGYLVMLTFLVLAVSFYFINRNFYFLFSFILIILDIVSLLEYISKTKFKWLILAIACISLTLVSLGLAMLNLESLIILAIAIIATIISGLFYLLKNR